MELTEKLDDFHRVMKGTNQKDPRCAALRGSAGVRVSCAIYAQRPSVCREFAPAWFNSEPNERCDRARIARGLLPLSPESWKNPEPVFAMPSHYPGGGSQSRRSGGKERGR